MSEGGIVTQVAPRSSRAYKNQRTKKDVRGDGGREEGTEEASRLLPPNAAEPSQACHALAQKEGEPMRHSPAHPS